jgi:gluconolactonase
VVFTCPAGSDGLVPTLAGKTTSLVANAPNLDGESETNGFLEGPVWIDGKLYVSQLRVYGDQPPARILVLDGTTLSEFIPNSGTNGLAYDGVKLLAASHADHGIVSFTLASPSVKAIIANSFDIDPSSGDPAQGFNSPNDLTVRSDGNIYFTDPNYQCGGNCPQGSTNSRVYRIAPGGEISVIPSLHQQPNGISLSPDEATLYVGGTGGLEKYPLGADGSVGARADFASSVTGVDGMTVDCSGNVYAAINSQQKITVVKADGTVLPDSIGVGVAVTNVAFGGADHQTLYVTTYSKALHSVQLDVPGYPY